MTNKKITDLVELTTPTTDDVFPLVDIATNSTKKAQLANLPISTATQTAINAKQDTLVSGTNIKTINSTSLLGSGDISVVANPAGTAGQIQFSDGSAFAADSNLFWDNTNKRLGVGTSTPGYGLDVSGVIRSNTTGVNFYGNNTDAKIYLNGTQGSEIAYGNYGYSAAGGWNQIGGNTTISANTYRNGILNLGARLGVRGSGSTSATTSLLVQNSAGTQVLKATDDGKLTIGTNAGNSGTLLFQYPGITNGVYWGDDYSTIWGSITLDRNSGEMRISGNAGGYYPTIYSNGQEVVRITTSQQMGIGTASPTARLQVKGSGSTSATTALLVQNSSGANIFKVQDDQETKAFGTFRVTDSGENNAMIMFGNGYGGTKTLWVNGTLGVGALGTNSSARLQVDSTTQGFLPPRMTTTQKNAISTPAAGLIVYDTDTNKLCCYNGTTWNDLF